MNMNLRMSSLFNEKKAAEVAAYFLVRASKPKKIITLLKLMKLMYLSERLSYQKFGHPIIGDALVSMPHGPVLSKTLDLMNVGSSKKLSPWVRLISDKSNRDMSLKEKLTIDDLRELSDADLEVLKTIWNDFGQRSASTLRNYTHDPKNCPEWQDPDGSSVPIQLETLLEKIGYAAPDVAEIVENTRKQAWINSALSSS